MRANLRPFRSISAKLHDLFWARLAGRSASERAFLFLLPVMGIVVGVSSVVIAHLIAYMETLFWGSGDNLLDAVQKNPWPFVLLIPSVGGLLVGLIGWRLRLETRGAGTAGLIQSLALRGGFVSLRQTLPRVAAAGITIATGGSLGREGPMVQMAGALGSYIGRRFHLTPQHLRTLVCAAAASALAAVYNAPIGGSIFALEILMGNFALEVFGPVVVASVISTLIFRSAMGDLPRFVVPHYELVSGWEIGAYLVLGVLGGLVSILFVRTLSSAEDLFEKIRLPSWSKPFVGFLLLAGLGCATPHVFGNGYSTVNAVLHEQLPLTLLLVLPVAKIVATALTFGSGGGGGLFTPSLMVGALVGGAFGVGAHTWFPSHTAEHGAYALVGMGAIVAGTTHAPLTAIMMIFEQTNSYQIVLPLMFACIVSHVTVRLFGARSLHEEALIRRGVTLPRGPEASVMQTMRVREIMHEDVVAVRENATFAAVVSEFLRAPHNFLYVVDDGQRFLGAIPLHALKEMLPQSESLKSVVAVDLLDQAFAFVTPDQKLADTMETFWRQNCERLPVVSNSTERTLLGWVSKRDLIGIYNQEILQKRQLLGRFAIHDETGQRETFVELPQGFQLQTVVVPATYEGRMISDLAPRSTYGVHALALKRRDPLTGQEHVDLPGPKTVLRAGDRLTIIGKFENIAEFMSALALPIEKPGN
jgi:CIC family chloride channel protein